VGLVDTHSQSLRDRKKSELKFALIARRSVSACFVLINLISGNANIRQLTEKFAEKRSSKERTSERVNWIWRKYKKPEKLNGTRR
jgi:hypothetical protein